MSSVPETRRFEMTVADDAPAARLDAFLAAAIPDLSRNRLKTLIVGGHVAIDGATIVEPKRGVKPGQAIEVVLPPPIAATPTPQAIPLDIVYEDDALIVIDKPAGMVVHPGAGNHDGTLVNALLAHCGDSLSGIGGVSRPGIVHRLDKDTTGLLVVAKNDTSHRALADQFADHGRTGPLERAYQALVWGLPPRREGKVEARLARARHNREKMAIVRDGGRHAVTHYAVEEVFGDDQASRLICRLETGRTHQIRVHMASLGNPLIGDPTYGAGYFTKAQSLPAPQKNAVESLKRHALHAWQLGFAHPTSGETMRFESPFPADFSHLAASLRELVKTS